MLQVLLKPHSYKEAEPGHVAQEPKSFTCCPHCHLTECQESVELVLGKFQEGFLEVIFELGFKSELFTNV